MAPLTSILFSLASAAVLAVATGVIPEILGTAVDMTNGKGGAYPRANYLKDGSIIGAYTAGVTVDGQTNNTLTLVRSTDSGLSWTEIGTAASRQSNSSDLDNPFSLTLPCGRVLLAYRNHDKVEGSVANYTYFRITISYSDNNGSDWLYLSDPISYAGQEYYGAWEPFLRLSQDNTLQMYWSQENNQTDQDILMMSSTDGGLTWFNRRIVAGADVISRDGMPGVAITNGNGTNGTSLIAIFESDNTTNTNLFTVHSVTSPDDGVTWQNRRLVYQPNGIQTNAGSPQVVNVGGTLVASFMTDEDTQAQDWANGAAAKLLTSTDGVTWGHKLEVFAPDAYWPGMLPLNGSEFLYMCNTNGSHSQQIKLV
jgi:hypothetical protein